MLWLCLYFPLLPLEIQVRGARPHPAAVTRKAGAGERVWLCNSAAADRGVSAGTRVAAAQALVPELQLHARDKAAESRVLKRLAAWCGQFSDCISLGSSGFRIQDSGGRKRNAEGGGSLHVLLEIQGSLSLFGGLGQLMSEVSSGADELGFQVCMGVAPTPVSAALLARRGGRVASEQAELLRQLDRLPVTELDLPAQQVSALRGMGIDSFGAWRKLPREGLARRLGPEAVDYLDRLLGRVPDPVPRFVMPQRYAASLPLPLETETSEALLFPLQRLVGELCGILQGRAAGIQLLHIDLAHQHTVTRLRVGLVAPSREPGHLMMLIRERLDGVGLDAPVQEVGLRARRFHPLEAHNGDLFSEPRGPGGEQFIDRLRVKLGDGAVDGVSCYPEHRPENAWCRAAPGEHRAPAPVRPPRRPLWLLDQPLALELHDGRPCYRGRLSLLEGPERIESGWWDGGDVARDYFVAGNERGAQYWVFRDLRDTRGWFLHGIFS